MPAFVNGMIWYSEQEKHENNLASFIVCLDSTPFYMFRKRNKLNKIIKKEKQNIFKLKQNKKI